MLKKIEALRERPKHVRNAYAFWIALSITLCIAFMWGVLKTTELSGSDVVAEEKNTPSSLARTFGDVKNYVWSIIVNLRADTEYVRPEDPYVPKADTLNLDALFASSTQLQKEEALMKASTTLTATATAHSTY